MSFDTRLPADGAYFLLQELASMLEGGSQTRWGNNVGYVLFPIPLKYHPDTLDHVRAAKKISDRKKLSYEAYFTYWGASVLMYISGPKVCVSAS